MTEMTAPVLRDLPSAKAAGAGQRRQGGLEVGTEAAGGDPRGNDTAGQLAAPRAGQAVHAVLAHDRLELGPFGDLVDQRFGVVTGQLVMTPPAGGRLAVGRRADLLGGGQGE